MGKTVNAWKRLSLPLRLYIGLILFSIAGTVLSKVSKLDPGFIPPVASILTLGLGFWTLVHQVEDQKRIWRVLSIGLYAELIGLFTGWVFGKYEYTGRWWPTIFLPGGYHFPVQLPFAWMLVAGGSYFVFRNIPRWLRVILAASLAALIDLLMEPVMVDRLQYWRWLDGGPLPGGAPWMNLIGWFLVSLSAAFVLSKEPAVKADVTESRWVLGLYCLLIFTIWMAQ